MPAHDIDGVLLCVGDVVASAASPRLRYEIQAVGRGSSPHNGQILIMGRWEDARRWRVRRATEPAETYS